VSGLGRLAARPHLRYLAAGVALAVLVGCAVTHPGSTGTADMATWRAYHGPVLVDLEELAVRGARAFQAHDYPALGSVCQDGIELIGRARAGPVADDSELQLHYAAMEDAYAAGFSVCAEGTPAGADRSLDALDNGNAQLRATTARLIVLAAN
jgi:hypothetical protein